MSPLRMLWASFSGARSEVGPDALSALYWAMACAIRSSRTKLPWSPVAMAL